MSDQASSIIKKINCEDVLDLWCIAIFGRTWGKEPVGGLFRWRLDTHQKNDWDKDLETSLTIDLWEIDIEILMLFQHLALLREGRLDHHIMQLNIWSKCLKLKKRNILTWSLLMWQLVVAKKKKMGGDAMNTIKTDRINLVRLFCFVLFWWSIQ